MAPSGAKSRFAANLRAIEIVEELERDGREATSLEQALLARWSSWGAIPQVFDPANEDWATERAVLRSRLTDAEWDEARRSTINAHFTDPAYVSEMWAAMGRLGFTGGEVLEPGSGAGTFIGMAPAGATMTGVELDSMSARISQALYPSATIANESFADSRYPVGHFDAAVGNVPFGQVTLHDPRFNASGHSIHNHFILKSLQLTRPGGLVAVLTSHYTLDAQDPTARREMNDLADLVGAVRLPTGAHRRAAGTDAVTDLLIFRRRERGVAPASDVWETVTARTAGDVVVKRNAYFDVHPDRILGDEVYEMGMYGREQIKVVSDPADAPRRLRDALQEVTDRAVEAGLVATAASEGIVAQRAAYVPADPTLWEGTIVANADRSFSQVAEGALVPFAVPRAHQVEVRALVELRSSTTALLTLEAATLEDTAEIAAARAQLRIRYDAYQAKFGPLNRYTERRTGRVDEETGEERMARVSPTATRLFWQDPFGPMVLALERFDDETGTSSPAAIVTSRVVAPRPVVLGAETAADALSMSLDRTGGVDVPLIADLLGTTEQEALGALGESVFYDPDVDAHVHAPAYLSGDVRGRCDRIRELVVDRPELERNLRALEDVMPADLGIEDVKPALGAVWIDRATHEQFLRELLDQPQIRVANPLPGQWKVSNGSRTPKSTVDFGTERRPAYDIVEALMAQRPLIVQDKTDDGGLVINDVETTAAQDKAEQLHEQFESWVWKDPERSHRLLLEYNRRFNNIVLRDYTDAGKYLTFPGMSATFTMMDHQLATIARGIAEPALGMFHEVGAGKTAASIALTMKQKQMGLISKPCVIVPNHMLGQFTAEWLQLYPQATLLAADSGDLASDKRRAFVARAAAGDWDAIVLTQNAFKSIGMDPRTIADYAAREAERLGAAMEKATADDEEKSTVKQIELAKEKAEERTKKALAKPRDPGITFEATGIDYLVVDELHMYKNLATSSKIPDANITGSDKATDLHMKLEWLRSKRGLRVIAGLTATPLANSITEAHVMQRYLRPDLLERSNVLDFDSWAATFGKTVTALELAPTANGTFRQKTRFARFQNVPEMLKMWRVFADVKTAEDLNLPKPKLRIRSDGQRAPETIVIPATPDLQRVMEDIGDRASNLSGRAKKGADNMLTLVGRARLAATDTRLIGLPQQRGWSKLDEVASRILSEWRTTRGNQYLDATTGEPSPVPGGAQIVFIDLGTPRDTWNAYDGLRRLLEHGGMPADRIRYIHDARNNAEKARMFAAARAGHVSVLFGSTEKMGAGTNMQTRVTALHHVDAPWRPADVAQRDGRGVRQGNQNEEIGLFRYVVEGSFDGYVWQGIGRKAGFIGQIMRGRLDVREIEDIGPMEISATEAKALASGNPLLLEDAEARSELARLRRQEKAFQQAQDNLASNRRWTLGTIKDLDRDLELLSAAAATVRPTAGDQFSMTVGTERTTARADAAASLASWARREHIEYLNIRLGAERPLGTVGEIGGLPISAIAHRGLNSSDRPKITFVLGGLTGYPIIADGNGFDEQARGLITRFENSAALIEQRIRDAQRERQTAVADLGEIDARTGGTFAHRDELDQARAKVADIARRIAEQDKATRQPAPEPAPAAADEPKRTRLLDRLRAAVEDAEPYRGLDTDRSQHHGPDHDSPGVSIRGRQQ